MSFALLLALSPAANAQDFRAWQGVYEGLLMEAADGDTASAVSWYDGLISGLPEGDPVQGELHFWLGQALYSSGQREVGRQMLELAANGSSVEQQSTAMLGQINALELRIPSLPLEQDFDDDVGMWLHSWQYGTKGQLDVAVPDGEGDPALAWTTEVNPREDDQIELWFGEDAQPQELEVRIRSGEFPAYLMLILFDAEGHWYTLPDFVVATPDQWVHIDASIEDFIPLPLESGVTRRELSPDRVRSMALRDVTAYYSTDQGKNVIYLDRMRIR